MEYLKLLSCILVLLYCAGVNGQCVRHALEFRAQDTWIDWNNPLANHYLDYQLYVSANKTRALLQFNNVMRDIFQSAHGSTTRVISATLSLEIKEIGEEAEWEDPEVAVHLLDGSFEHDEANWNCRAYGPCTDCCKQWRMLNYGSFVQASYSATPSDVENVQPGQTGSLEFDVTNDVVQLVQGPFKKSISWLVKKDCEEDAGHAYFDSCETPNCPLLVIELESCPDPQPESPGPCQEGPSWDGIEKKKCDPYSGWKVNV